MGKHSSEILQEIQDTEVISVRAQDLKISPKSFHYPSPSSFPEKENLILDFKTSKGVAAFTLELWWMNK